LFYQCKFIKNLLGTGSRGRGRGNKNNTRENQEKYDKDFDFEQSNAKFNKEEIQKELLNVLNRVKLTDDTHVC